jgi:hypothetical protein
MRSDDDSVSAALDMPVDRHLLALLDGTRDRNALLEELVAIAGEHPLLVERDCEQVSGEAELRDALAEHIDSLPQRLAEMKLMRVE